MTPVGCITYSLKADDTTSELYYQTIRQFAQAVAAFIKQRLASLVERYTQYQSEHGGRVPATEEACLDLLALGVYWCEYGQRAVKMSQPTIGILSCLAGLRLKGGFRKAVADRLRGMILTFSFDRQPTTNQPKCFTVSDACRLIAWMRAVGDFAPEADRLRALVDLLKQEPTTLAASDLAGIADCAQWFAEQSLVTLGCYSSGVEQYLSTAYQSCRWHEDVVYCARERIDYHLNMVGAELLNRALRSDFLRTGRTELLLPGCMRAKTAGECQAKPDQLGLKCTGCTPGCRVHQLTLLGARQEFQVRIAAHESEVLADGGAERLRAEDVGVVGVACVPNLISGGWKLQAHGIPAQCVLLECSGCQKHWRQECTPTDLNLRQLERVICRAKTEDVTSTKTHLMSSAF